MTAIVIGGGPAGLMAAEVLAERGNAVALYDSMPSPGRKFLLAGKGGLNLTHSESMGCFIPRYGARAGLFQSLLAEFGPADLRNWAKSLGIDTFVGSSGKVFPDGMKAAPLLRAWVILPSATVAVAMSSSSGGRLAAGTAIAIGLVETTEPLLPW